MGTGWGACKVIAFWALVLSFLYGCGLASMADRVECGRHMQHCQGEGAGK
jgi:hypothetical protein